MTRTGVFDTEYLIVDCWRRAAGLIGNVSVDDLSDVLAGLDPRTGDPLGRPLLDQITTTGKVTPAASGPYQSVLRAALTNRFGVAFDDIDNGLAETAGVPVELIAKFSKRAADIDIEMDERVGAFID